MRRLPLVVLFLFAACSGKKEPPKSADPAPATAKPAEPAPAPAPSAAPAPAPTGAPAPSAAPAPTAKRDDGNGGIRELFAYGAGPDGKPEPYGRYKAADGETLLGADAKVASWIPGSGNGGPGDEALDVAVVAAAGKAQIVFAPEKSPRATLPLAIAAGDVDPTQVAFEERGQHRAMVRIGAKDAGPMEAYLISWDAKAHAPVVVEHFQGKTEQLPAWAVSEP